VFDASTRPAHRSSVPLRRVPDITWTDKAGVKQGHTQLQFTQMTRTTSLASTASPTATGTAERGEARRRKNAWKFMTDTTPTAITHAAKVAQLRITQTGLSGGKLENEEADATEVSSGWRRRRIPQRT